VERPEVVDAVAEYDGIQSLEDLAFHRSETLTLLAAVLPPGFSAAPHNHNLWSVVGVCRGREDNRFFEREGQGLTEVAQASVVGPGVLPNDPEVIHAIHNPLDTPLLALHAYGGDLLSTPRSNWDPETHEEIPYDWDKVRSESQE
jgi:predicted metal-dependent enzyme (double-stranded beta helix superfamily)